MSTFKKCQMLLAAFAGFVILAACTDQSAENANLPGVSSPGVYYKEGESFKKLEEVTFRKDVMELESLGGNRSVRVDFFIESDATPLNSDLLKSDGLVISGSDLTKMSLWRYEDTDGKYFVVLHDQQNPDTKVQGTLLKLNEDYNIEEVGDGSDLKRILITGNISPGAYILWYRTSDVEGWHKVALQIGGGS